MDDVLQAEMSRLFEKYPEHRKSFVFMLQQDIIKSFLSWLEKNKNMSLCLYQEQNKIEPVHEPLRKLIAEYLAIDLEKYDQEEPAFREEMNALMFANMPARSV